jgi:hypothetical protein
MEQKKRTVSEKNVEANNIPVKIDQPFFNLRQSWVIKGACSSFSAFRRTRWFQPKGGHEDGKIGGIKVFTNETIREWLPLTDEKLEEYHRKYKTGAKPRAKIETRRKNRKGATA